MLGAGGEKLTWRRQSFSYAMYLSLDYGAKL
jgi:hypothetical protein